MRHATVREVCKFLSGAFFVSAGVLLYLSIIRLAVPVLGTHYVQSPEVSRLRALVHGGLFALTFYLGFIRRPRITISGR